MEHELTASETASSSVVTATRQMNDNAQYQPVDIAMQDQFSHGAAECHIGNAGGQHEEERTPDIMKE